MPEKCKKFISILKLEMEDLEEDVRMVRELYRERKEKGEITRYVLLENEGLIENELAGFRYLRAKLDEVDPLAFGSYDALAEHVADFLKNKCLESDYPDGVYSFVEKRIQKVLKYMKEM